MVKKHTWNAIKSALIFFSSSVKDFFFLGGFFGAMAAS
jgi:hypothetical protein